MKVINDEYDLFITNKPLTLIRLPPGRKALKEK